MGWGTDAMTDFLSLKREPGPTFYLVLYGVYMHAWGRCPPWLGFRWS